MKSNFIKTAASAALSAALLASVAFAAPANTIPLEGGEHVEAPAYEISVRNSAQPVRVVGKAVELGENSVTIEEETGADTTSKVIVNVAEDTAIVDAVTGEARSFADIKENETLYAWVGPVMTRSLPPMTTGRVIVCNVPEDFSAPAYSEVQSVTKHDDGGVSLYVTGEMVLHLSADTDLSAYKTKNVVGLDELKPGDRILSWYEMVMMSYPGQATPGKVVVFPYGYEGYVSADGLTVSVNGAELAVPGKAEENRLMVPVRALAEALGCQVTWEAETNSVVVKQGEDTLYSFTIGGGDATREGDMVVSLLAPTSAADGVTYMALEDLANLHDLKVAQGFSF